MSDDDAHAENWPWDQAPNVAALTVASILAGAPILHVSHDVADHGWQFLDGELADVEQGRVIGMGEVLRLDPTLLAIADLPPGWVAWRDRVGGPWTRAVHPTDPPRNEGSA